METMIGPCAPLSKASDFWSAYRAWRLQLLLLPPSEVEEEVARRVAEAMGRYLGLEPATATAHARRNTLLGRETRFHESLALDLAPARLDALLDRVEVEGKERLNDRPVGRGILLVAPHYSVFSSLLPLWLARLAACGTFPRLTIVLESGKRGSLGFPDRRIGELEAAGIVRADATAFLDLRAGRTATRVLRDRLLAGQAALVFPDAHFGPADGRGLPFTLGGHPVQLPRGVAWLARQTECAIVPLWIRPRDETHRIEIGTPAISDAARAPTIARMTLQYLLERAIKTDPAPWHNWLALPAQPGDRT